MRYQELEPFPEYNQPTEESQIIGLKGLSALTCLLFLALLAESYLGHYKAYEAGTGLLTWLPIFLAGSGALVSLVLALRPRPLTLWLYRFVLSCTLPVAVVGSLVHLSLRMHFPQVFDNFTVPPLAGPLSFLLPALLGMGGEVFLGTRKIFSGGIPRRKAD